MRLSSVQIFQQGISAILDQQAKLNQTQQQLATGKRILNPSDDPVAAVQILDITEDLALVDQYKRNGSLAEGQLALEESVLASVGNVLQRVRELVVQANNATQGPETRNTIATEIETRLDELQSLANTRDASGEYIFAGYQSDTEPFARQGNNFSYNGDDGQRFLQLGSSSQVSVRDSGFDVFMSVPSGNGTFDVEPNTANTGAAVVGATSINGSFVPDNYVVSFTQATPSDPITYQVMDSSPAVIAGGTYVPGDTIIFPGVSLQFDGVPADGDSFDVTPSIKQDVFTSLQLIIDDLKNSGSSSAATAVVNNGMAQGLNNLDQALGHVLGIRAEVGVRMNHVENQLNINESFTLQLQDTLSNIQDLDFAEAISRLNLQLTALQAAQQTYVKVQGLSLFNYL
ncbi:MAG: flagellar hook-associated protein 3 [Porticoccaceae bacterium]|nr:MAG: flagellar hook-associated protein 3 [Porticoccaceae bacterium]